MYQLLSSKYTSLAPITTVLADKKKHLQVGLPHEATGNILQSTSHHADPQRRYQIAQQLGINPTGTSTLGLTSSTINMVWLHIRPSLLQRYIYNAVCYFFLMLDSTVDVSMNPLPCFTTLVC